MDESMIESRLADAADRLPVGAAPVGRMVAGARRARRRRAAVRAGLVSTAVAVVMVGAAALLPDPPRGAPATDSGPAPVPAGHRLVGVGAVGAVVPTSWGLNETRCGTPTADTLVVDGGVQCLMLVPRPEGVESLEIVEGAAPPELKAGHVDSTVAGQPAQVTDVDCASLSLRRMSVCQMAVHLPDLEIGFIATSSTQPQAAARAAVEQMVSHIRMLPAGQVGVPSHRRVPMTVHMGEEGRVEWYVRRLAAVGLVAEVPETSRSAPDPHIVDVLPGPGTVVAEGDTVRLVTD